MSDLKTLSQAQSKSHLEAIGSSFRRFFAGTLFSRATGFFRELAMAALFGISVEVAAFWMAFRFSHLLRRLFGEGGLHVAFVPHFERLKKESPKEAYGFFLGLFLGLGALLFILALLIEAALGSALFFGNLSEETSLVTRLTFLMLPSFIFVSLYALNASFLQCEESYFLASAAPALLNVVWVVTLLFLPSHQGRALEILSMVIVAALGLKWFVTWLAVFKKIRPHLEGIKWLKFKEYMAILRPFALALVGVGATQLNTFFDAFFARFADPEGPALLWYAARLQQLPLALVGVGVSAAFFPPIARAAEERERYRELINQAIRRTLACMIPLTSALLVLGLSSTDFVYGRGAFGVSALTKTTSALWAYSLGLVPSTLVFILASAFYARKNYRTPTIASVLAMLFSLVANSLLVFFFSIGATAIALTTTLSAFLNAGSSRFCSQKRDRQLLPGALQERL